ncbi:fimbrial biogenesis chaperone [Anabaena azotica]|uniref:P pilus assembly protein, chaperone PapD n=1 Tax=Anabaena azotica FACHB-119 TaxID=947527 RepID=A0ABR8D901_9NOST|nr:hypothetical protein [Anabaena azotica]MBD2503624.1 hypothetical protein [Anabaena azotica FACHB-119]
MFSYRFFLPLSSILVSSFLIWVNVAKANILVSPMIFETQENRGQAQGLITVTNLDSQAFRARVYTLPFTYNKETGFQTLSSSPNDLSPYLRFSPQEMQVPGSTQRNIRFVVRFPPSLPDGEYRTMIFTEDLQATTVTRNDEKNNVVVNTDLVPRIGVAVYVRKGNILANIIPDSTRLNPQGEIQLLVQNKGKASAIVGGNWTIKQENQVVKTGKIRDTTVIAEGERYLLVDAPTKDKSALLPGKYEVSGELVWGENKKNKIPFNLNLTVPRN